MTAQDVQRIAQQTFDAHPELRQTEQAEELLRRTIWRLNQAGIRAGRQRNPSGLLSKDKLAVTLSDGDHAYDLYGLQTPLTFAFSEVTPPNLVPDEGIPETSDPSAPPPSGGHTAAPEPIVDLAPMIARIDSLTDALASLAALHALENVAAERRYQDLVNRFVNFQLEGTVTQRFIGTSPIVLSVPLPKGKS